MAKYKIGDLMPQCCKELGKPGRWHQCDERAVRIVESKTVPGLYLHYCNKH